MPHLSFSLRFTVVVFLCAGIEHTGVRGRHRRYRPGSEAFPRVQLDRPWSSTPRLQRRGEGAGLARAGALEPDALREGAPQLTSTRFWFPLLLGLPQHLDTPTHVPTRTHARMHAHPVSWDYKVICPHRRIWISRIDKEKKKDDGLDDDWCLQSSPFFFFFLSFFFFFLFLALRYAVPLRPRGWRLRCRWPTGRITPALRVSCG